MGLRDLVTRLIVDSSEAKKGFEEGAQAAKKYADTVKDGSERAGAAHAKLADKVGQSVLAWSALGTAASSTLASMTKAYYSATDAAKAFYNQSLRSGVGVTGLQKLKEAGDELGISMEVMTRQIFRMQRQLGTGKQDNILRQMGLDPAELRKMGAGEAFEQIGTSILKVGNAATQAELAGRLFGDRTGKMFQFLRGGGIELGKEMEQLGVIMDEKTVVGLRNVSVQSHELGTVYEGLIRNMALSVAPINVQIGALAGLKEAVGTASKALQDWNKEHEGSVDSQQRAAQATFSWATSVVTAIKGVVEGYYALRLGFAETIAASLEVIVSVGEKVSGLAHKLGIFGAFLGLPHGAALTQMDAGIADLKNWAKGFRDAATEAVSGADSALSKIEAVQKALAGHKVSGLGSTAVPKPEGGTGEIDFGAGKKPKKSEKEKNIEYIQKETARLEAENSKWFTRMSGAEDTKGFAALMKEAAAATKEEEHALRLLGPTALDVAANFRDLQEAVLIRGGPIQGIAGLDKSELTAYISKMKPLVETGKLGSEGMNSYYDALSLAFQKGITPMVVGTTKVKKETFEWGKALQTVANIMQGFGGKAGGIAGAMATGISGVASILKGFDSKSLGGGFKTMMKGLGGGSGVEGFLQGLTGAFGLASTAIGVGKAIIGLFKKDPIKEAQKEIGKALGHGVSYEFAKQVRELSKEMGKSLADVAKMLENESRMKQTIDLQSRQKSGMQYAVAGLGMTVRGKRPEGFSGQWTEGEALIKGNALEQGRIWQATFWGAVATEGVVSAADAFKAMFGEGKTAAMVPEDVVAMMNAFADPGPLRDAAQAAQGYAQSLSGLAQAGWLNKEMFADYGTILNAGYQQAIDSGSTEKQALLAVLPLLAEMKQLHEQTGVALDENTQKLIAEAEAQGIAFPVDPMIQVRDILLEIAKVLGATIPASAEAARNSMNGLGDGVTGGGGNPMPTHGGGPPDLTSAGGLGPVTFGNDTILQVHRGEKGVIVPKGRKGSWAYITAARGLYSPESGELGTGGAGGYTPPDATSATTSAPEQMAALQEAIANVQQAATELARTQPINITNAPSIQLVDQSLVKTPEGQRAFGTYVQTEMERALDQNSRGLTTKVEQIARRAVGV